MGDGGLPVQVLLEAAAMGDDELVQVIQRRLSVAVDVRNDAAKDGRAIIGRGPQLGVQILELDLLPTEVVGEASKIRGSVLVTLLVFELIYDCLSAVAQVPIS